MTEEVKKCKHIWAHEQWCHSVGVGDRETQKYPPGLYKNGKQTLSCCGELITKKQWQ